MTPPHILIFTTDSQLSDFNEEDLADLHDTLSYTHTMPHADTMRQMDVDLFVCELILGDMVIDVDEHLLQQLSVFSMVMSIPVIVATFPGHKVVAAERFRAYDIVWLESPFSDNDAKALIKQLLEQAKA